MKNNNKRDPDILSSVNFYSSWMAIFKTLSDYESRLLLKCISWYSFEKLEPTEVFFDGIWRVKEAWNSIKPELDRQFVKYREWLSKYTNNDNI